MKINNSNSFLGKTSELQTTTDDTITAFGSSFDDDPGANWTFRRDPPTVGAVAHPSPPGPAALHALTTVSGSAMVINATINSAGAPAGFASAVDDAIAYFEHTFTNGVTMNITFDWAALTGNAIAQSNTNLLSFSYSSVVAALTSKDSAIAADLGLVLPGSDPFPAGATATYPIATPANTLWLTFAEATALGLSTINSSPTNTTQDGTITLNSNNAYNFDPTLGGVAGTFDAAPTLEHEISEMMGRQFGGNNPADDGLLPEPLALFRYSSPGVVDTSQNYAGGYFSIDGGQTNLRSNFGEHNGDFADWGDTSDDCVGFGQTGVAEYFTPIDVQVMEALGWVTSNDDYWLGGSTDAWTTARDWTNGIATSTSNIVVDQGAPQIEASIMIASLTNSAKVYFVADGQSMISGNLDNTGYIDLADASVSSSLMVAGSIVNDGEIDVQQNSVLYGGANVSGAGFINLETGGALDLVAATSAAVSASGQIIGAGSVNLSSHVSGFVTFTLSGANTYAGGTDVGFDATLSISAATNIGSGGLTLENGTGVDLTAAMTLGVGVTVKGAATLDDFGNSGNHFTGSITGAGSLVVTGGGGIVLEVDDAIAGGITMMGGTIEILTDRALGAGTLTLDNNAGFDLGGSLTVANAIAINGASIFATQSGATDTFSAAIGDSAGKGGVTFEGGGTFNFTAANSFSGGTTILAGNMLAVSGQGTLGSGGVTLAVGATLSIATGAAPALKGTSSFQGLVSGLGTLSLTGGAATFGPGVSLTVANWSVTVGGSVTIATNVGYFGKFLGGGIPSITINSGDTLALDGQTTLNGAVNGAGALVVGGGAAMIASNASLAVSRWSVLGSTVTLNKNLVYTGAFTQGPHGTVSVSTNDTLTLKGASTLGGKTTGAGALALTGGATTISSGATFSTAKWSISGTATHVTSSDALTYAGAFSLGAGSTLTLNTGPLTLTGSVGFNGGTVNGSKQFVVKGATTVTGLTVGGTDQWNNAGAVTETGQVTIGDATGAVAALVNSATATYNIINNAGFSRGTATASAIYNAGVLEKTGGTGTSLIAPAIANSGVISATSGTLDLAGAVSGTGTLQVGAGATLEVDKTVAAGQTLSFSGSGGEVSLADLDAAGVQLFHGTIGNFGAGDLIDIGKMFGATPGLLFTPNGAGGALKITGNSVTASVLFSGTYNSGNFMPTTNSGGDTVLNFHA